MGRKLGLYFAVSSIIAWNVQASDDVIVDLSVLDNLPQDSIGFVPSEPLFPVIKASSVKKTAASPAKKQPKKVVKLKKPEPIKPKAEKTIESNTVKKQNIENPFAQKVEKPEVTAPKNTVKVYEVAENAKDETLLQKNQPQTVSAEPVKEGVVAPQTTPAEPVRETVAMPQETVAEPVRETVAMPQETVAEPVSETVSMPQEASVKTVEQEKTNDSNMIDDTEKTKENPFAMPQNILPQSLEAENALSAKLSEPINASQSQSKKIYAIPFEEGSTELSAEAQSMLEEFAQVLNKEEKKKIAIKAYNYNDGTNVFRKKRICLNRATEIRSYLLNRGFKNFSIKIINTNTDNEYKDTVEIEEIN